MRFAVFLMLLLFFSAPAQAQEVYECGTPEHPGLEKTDDPQFWRYCDIYDRRFLYAEEQKSFRENLDKRRANYATYRQEALDDYKSRLDLYYLLMD